MVECHLAKVKVAGPNPVSRSINYCIWHHGQVVRQRSAKPLFSSSNLDGASKRRFYRLTKKHMTLVILYIPFAGVAELADARDLKSLGRIVHIGSSPILGTKTSHKLCEVFLYKNCKGNQRFLFCQFIIIEKFGFKALKQI